MPKSSKLLLLPSDVLDQLDQRLRQSQFAGFVSHEQWLKSLGHDVGRTAIHAYSQQQRSRIKSGVRIGSPAQLAAAVKAADQRIECLKVAASIAPAGADAARLKLVARDLFNWASRG